MVIGVVRLNSETCKYLVEKNKSKTPPTTNTKSVWINDHEALECAGCNLNFSMTERKVCKMCVNKGLKNAASLQSMWVNFL